MRNVAFDLYPDAQADKCGEAAVWHCGIELYSDHVHIIRGGLLNDDSCFTDDVKILQGLGFLWISDGAQVVWERRLI